MYILTICSRSNVYFEYKLLVMATRNKQLRQQFTINQTATCKSGIPVRTYTNLLEFKGI